MHSTAVLWEPWIPYGIHGLFMQRTGISSAFPWVAERPDFAVPDSCCSNRSLASAILKPGFALFLKPKCPAPGRLVTDLVFQRDFSVILSLCNTGLCYLNSLFLGGFSSLLHIAAAS